MEDADKYYAQQVLHEASSLLFYGRAILAVRFQLVLMPIGKGTDSCLYFQTRLVGVGFYFCLKV